MDVVYVNQCIFCDFSHIEIQIANHFLSQKFRLLWFFKNKTWLKEAIFFGDQYVRLEQCLTWHVKRLILTIGLWRNRWPLFTENWQWLIGGAHFSGSSVNAVSKRYNQLDEVHRNWTKSGFVSPDLKTLMWILICLQQRQDFSYFYCYCNLPKNMLNFIYLI
jgi:hypothetical protein